MALAALLVGIAQLIVAIVALRRKQVPEHQPPPQTPQAASEETACGYSERRLRKNLISAAYANFPRRLCPRGRHRLREVVPDHLQQAETAFCEV
jgi:hypothetical protein